MENPIRARPRDLVTKSLLQKPPAERPGQKGKEQLQQGTANHPTRIVAMGERSGFRRGGLVEACRAGFANGIEEELPSGIVGAATYRLCS